MNTFDHYSLLDASRSHSSHYPHTMDDDISPTSSRAASPTLEDVSMDSVIDPVTELSLHFDQQTLQACDQKPAVLDARTLLPPAIIVEPPSLPLKLSRRRSSSLLILQQRQAMSRRQCNPAHLSRISALVEDLACERQTSYDTAHPSSHDQSPVSPTSTPSSDSSLESTPTSSGAEDASFYPTPRIKRPLAHRVSKDLGPATSSEALERKQKLILKKVRMRKSSIKLKS